MTLKPSVQGIDDGRERGKDTVWAALTQDSLTQSIIKSFICRRCSPRERYWEVHIKTIKNISTQMFVCVCVCLQKNTFQLMNLTICMYADVCVCVCVCLLLRLSLPPLRALIAKPGNQTSGL